MLPALSGEAGSKWCLHPGGSRSKGECHRVGSSLSKLSRKTISPSESKSLSIPGGIKSSETRNVSTSSTRKSLSTTGIGEGGFSCTQRIRRMVSFYASILSTEKIDV
ncbi:hypothetical protein Tco_0221283 [Tanacetum coccineum]